MRKDITEVRKKLLTGGLAFVFVAAAWTAPVQAAQTDPPADILQEETDYSQPEEAPSGSEEETVYSLSEEELSELLDFVKEKWDAGELESDEAIRNAIEEGEEKFGVVLEDAARDQIADAIQKLDSLGLDHDTAIELAKKLYQEHGDKLADNFQNLYEQFGEKLADSAEQMIQEQVVEPAKETAKAVVEETAKNFWQDLKNSVVSFFRNIFS